MSMDQKKRVGIMGGTFNPIHNGHLLLAQQAKEYCDLDQILFIPSGNSYMKAHDEIPDGKLRIAMTALAIEDNSDFALSTIDVERQGATYTCETLKELKTSYPDTNYYFIIGADNLFFIESWWKPEEIFAGCSLIVASRGEKSSGELTLKAEELRQKYHADIILLPEKKFDISSTEIREKIRAGKSIKYFVPDKVIAYIEKNKLYRKNNEMQ